LIVAVCAVAGPLVHAADPQPYRVEIATTHDVELDKAISDASLLVNLRKKAPVGPFALIGRGRDDKSRFRDVLDGLGFYKGKITVRIAGRPLDDPELPDYLDSLPPERTVPVTISVALGPLFHLGTVSVKGLPPREASEKLGLAPGAPAVAATVLAARKQLLSALREEGYALATVSQPDARLDEPADVLDVAFTVERGPRLDIGPIGFQGLQRMNETFVRERLLLHQGERYDPRAIRKARQNLVSLGVFSSVLVVLGKKPDAQGELPLTFVVAERKRHLVSFNAAYSTDLGASASASWLNRNLLGDAEQLKLSAGFSAGGTARTGPGYWGGAQFIKPDFLRRDQILQLDISPLKESLNAYDRTAFTGSLSIKRPLSKHWTAGISVAGEQERVTQLDIEREVQQEIGRSFTLISLPLFANYDNTNDLLNPTRGMRAALTATPTRTFGSQGVNFVSLQASGSAYLDAGAWLGAAPGRTILALRGLVGDIEGAGRFELPADKRLYAGGSATVRGYKFQSVGPVFPNGRPQGGTAVVAGTVELRQRIAGNYGAVAFVDAGQVAASGFSFPGPWGIGAGVGARYYTSFGPIRLDLAFPVNTLPQSGSFQVYIGIGQAF